MVEGYISLAEARASQVGQVEAALPNIAAQVQAAGFGGPGPIFLGIGASHAAAGAAVWALRSRGVEASRVNAGDYPLPYPASSHPIIGVSQSGRSAETLAVLQSTEPNRRFAVTNVAPSPIADLAATPISLGNLANSYASTTGYTTTIAALAMIAEAWDGGVIDPSWSALPGSIRKLDQAMATRARIVAGWLSDASCVDYVAAAPSIGSAEVGSLLLREVARVPAAGFSTRQYLHGAMESAGGATHVLIGGERELGVAHTLARAGHRTVLITTLGAAEEDKLAVIRIDDISAAQRTILEAIVLQSLAVEAALLRGLDPDAFVFSHTDTKVAAQ